MRPPVGRARSLSAFRRYGLALALLTSGSTCREERRGEPPRRAAATAPAESTTESAREPDEAPEAQRAEEWATVKAILEATEDPDRWLTVTRVDPDKPGGWVTGRFDRARNRLELTTRGAQEFLVDVSRIPIDWERLVILRIDQRNTEMKKRDQAVYRFVRGSQGQWEVRQTP